MTAITASGLAFLFSPKVTEADQFSTPRVEAAGTTR